MPDVNQLIPTFHVRDVRQAAEWYRDKLGWQIRFVAAPDYAGVEVGGNILHLAQWQRDGEMELTQAFVKLNGGVDEYFEEVKSRGVEPYTKPTDHDYGMREFNLRDLDGNYLHIGQEIAQGKK